MQSPGAMMGAHPQAWEQPVLKRSKSEPSPTLLKGVAMATAALDDQAEARDIARRFCEQS